MSKVVLDSWPVLEATYGSIEVNSALDSLTPAQTPIMSAVNFGEVYNSVLTSRGILEARDTISLFRERIELEVPDLSRIMQAAHLKAHYYMALGDGFAVATAMHHDAELWTGDPELLFDGSPWRARDLRPGVAGARKLSAKEMRGKVGTRLPGVDRFNNDDPQVLISGLMDFLGLSEN